MPAKAFEAHVRREQPRAIVLELHGEINALAEEALNQAFAAAEHTGTETILLNFNDVTYMNSTGIALIVSLLARARALHIPLSVCGLSEHYREIFTITRLSDFMQVFGDEASALASTGSHPTTPTQTT